MLWNLVVTVLFVRRARPGIAHPLRCAVSRRVSPVLACGFEEFFTPSITAMAPRAHLPPSRGHRRPSARYSRSAPARPVPVRRPRDRGSPCSSEDHHQPNANRRTLLTAGILSLADDFLAAGFFARAGSAARTTGGTAGLETAQGAAGGLFPQSLFIHPIVFICCIPNPTLFCFSWISSTDPLLLRTCTPACTDARTCTESGWLKCSQST